MFYSQSTRGFYDHAIHGDGIPADAVEITKEQHAALLDGQSAGKLITADANGAPILSDQPAPTAEQVVASYTAAVQAHLDATASTRGYDGILSACTYATSTVAKFAAEGQACVNWRDAVWSECYALLADVKAGTHAIPATPADLVGLLPSMTWPQ